jgi:hypothetical protein
MHLTSETLDLYAAGIRKEPVTVHLEGCTVCRRRLARVEEHRAEFSRRFFEGSRDRISEWIRNAVAYDGRQ